MDIKQALIDFGVDYEDAMTRFLDDEDFYQEFLVKFTEDPFTNELKAALEASNIEEAFKVAHTLKGLCANFGFTPLLEFMKPLVEILRQGSLEGANELFEKYYDKYSALCKIIHTYCK